MSRTNAIDSGGTLSDTSVLPGWTCTESAETGSGPVHDSAGEAAPGIGAQQL